MNGKMMNSQRFRLLQTNEEGQSVVIVALFLFFVFLAFAALAVDGTIIYMHRRNLQNIADAATLAAAIELTQGNGEVAAYQTAMATIADNDGRIEWYSTSDPPNPAGAIISGTTNTNTGSGVDLVSGIEIGGKCDVRVALRWLDVGTFFAQFTGRDTLAVGARARSGCNAGGGMIPIAIKRYGDESDTDSWNPGKKNNPNTIYCEDCDTKIPLPGQGNGEAFDFLRPITGDVISGWPPGLSFFQSPSPHANKELGMPGREYYILGQGVESSFGSNEYRGLVLPDVRHISSAPREYYNGTSAGTNPSTTKDLAEYYIRHGYNTACDLSKNTCDFPAPGEEVATYPGTNTSFATKAFQETYNVGDVVAVIVYNGTVFKSPTLNLTGNPPMDATQPVSTSVAALNSAALTYTVSLEAASGFVSSPQGISMDVEGLAGFANWGYSNNSPLLPYNGGLTQRNVMLAITPTVTTIVVGTTTQEIVITGTQVFYVKAHDNKFGGTDIRHYWAGIVTVRDMDGTYKPALTALPTNTEGTFPYLTVEQGNQAKYTVNLDVWHAPGNHDVTLAYSGTLPSGFSWISAPPWTYSNLKDNKHPGAKHTLNIQVSSSATANQLYTLPFQASSPGMDTQTFNLYVFVVPPKTTIAEEYLQVLGYAAVEITDYPNVNAVEGMVVSELFTSPIDLTYGGRPRLIPWE